MMCTIRCRYILVVLAVLLLVAGKSHAADYLAESGSPLAGSFWPRASALGDIYPAVAGDPYSLFSNPAGIGGVRQVTLGLSTRIERQLDGGAGVVVFSPDERPFYIGAGAAYGRTWYKRNQTPGQRSGRLSYWGTQLVLGGGVRAGRLLNNPDLDPLTVGLNIKSTRLEYDTSETAGASVDLAGQYRHHTAVGDFTGTLLLRDLHGSSTFRSEAVGVDDGLPSATLLGLAWSRDYPSSVQMATVAAATLEKRHGGPDRIALGGELGLKPWISTDIRFLARSGFYFTQNQDESSWGFGNWSAGLGVEFAGFELGYAVSRFDQAIRDLGHGYHHVLSFSFTLDEVPVSRLLGGSNCDSLLAVQRRSSDSAVTALESHLDSTLAAGPERDSLLAAQRRLNDSLLMVVQHLRDTVTEVRRSVAGASAAGGQRRYYVDDSLLVQSLLSRNLFQPALDVLDNMAARWPDDPAVPQMVGSTTEARDLSRQFALAMARQHEREGHLAKALEAYSYLLRDDSADASAAAAYAQVEDRVEGVRLTHEGLRALQAGDSIAAARSFAEALRRNPNDEIAAFYHRAQPTTPGTFVSIEEIQADSNAFSHYQRGLEFNRNGELEAAIEEWRKVLDKYPGAQHVLENIRDAEARIRSRQTP